MKILHIITDLDVGGAELMLKRLIESHLGNPEYRHTVTSLTNVGKVGKQLQALGIEVNAIGMRRSPLSIPRALWRLVRQIRRSRADIVQTWMYHADLLGGVAARMAGNANLIWGIRHTGFAKDASRITVAIMRLCARLSHFVPYTIVCAAEASRLAHVGYGYCADRMMVVPNGFDISNLHATIEQKRALRKQCGFLDDQIVVGILGRYHPDKGYENFVRAAGLVADRNAHVRYLMVGRDIDINNQQLVRWLEDTGHADRFVLLGERTDVPVCLGVMDLFCLASRSEGFPNVVGEAMAMGLPCVVTDVGDAAMLVGETGVVVPKENPAALAEAIGKVLGMSAEQRSSLGERAKARIYADFTMQAARQRFELVYERVTGKGNH